MRELMTNLPSLILNEIEERPDPSSGSIAMKLPGLLTKHQDLDLAADQDMIPVPKEVATVFDALIKAAAKESGRNTRNAVALLTGENDSKVPAVGQWNATYKYFVGWAHLDRNFESHRELPSEEEILGNVRVVEDVVEVRAGMFFDNLRAVQDLLDDINIFREEVK